MAVLEHTAILTGIPRAYETAKAAGDLLFFPSEIHTNHDCAVNFRITLCPALQDKPVLPAPDFRSGQHGEKDPFAPPYNSNLFVGSLKYGGSGAEYVVLLNKYSVVPHHFLLVTKDFQSQTSPLMPPDLVQSYLILLAARRVGQHYFAFYNCGEESGASQPHKHIQFMPTEEDGPPIEELTSSANLEKEEKPFALPTLPFAHHIRRLSVAKKATWEEIEQILMTAYMELLDLCISTVRQTPDHPTGTPSYNIILTLNHLMLVPRTREYHTLQVTGERLPVNALGFAGMLLVKSKRELQAVLKEGPVSILRGVGCASVHDAQVSGGPEVDGDIGEA
ncbi:HIT-like domain-containing protein [Vararia minispora EC-137]|uniref:HIT-like domain-containing protein n=1 Tax=Vararia minispora EC-137 TaxID=1314806 RepID=A0ACB8Q7W6_9AGAM|nr:HIT-like domain-containing protein [Vararia minispora EC-137]